MILILLSTSELVILASTKLGKIWQPYISVSAKTKGWVAGDVYQDSNFSGRFGIRTFIK